MKPVLQHIFRLKRDYARLPFFDFLRDEALSTRERLAFFPSMASFIMAFGDLNRLVLREEPTDDPYLEMINAHTYEDDHHWPWYLEDFAKLGHDRERMEPGETIRFLYGDATIQNRLLSLRLAHLIWSAGPVVRLAIIEAIEETGNVLFALTSKIAAQFHNETGVELRYCGEFHFQLESGHAMNNDHAELATIELDEAQRRDALARVDKVFTWFADWTHELLAYARAAPTAQAGRRALELVPG
ncbi:MAG TPA: hypothetical protein PLT77_03890 [Burkholderiaceae bacterium]|nr:hypothetical protein [Burkholderiaceae bacterium]